jgi:hypothetical protein
MDAGNGSLGYKVEQGSGVLGVGVEIEVELGVPQGNWRAGWLAGVERLPDSARLGVVGFCPALVPVLSHSCLSRALDLPKR